MYKEVWSAGTETDTVADLRTNKLKEIHWLYTNKLKDFHWLYPAPGNLASYFCLCSQLSSPQTQA